jgi:histidinol-phosphate aminotransferase
MGGYGVHKAPETLEGTVEVPLASIVKLDANENPYGTSPGVERALASPADWHRYPDAGQMALRRYLQDYAGIDASYIVAANGSGEVLDEIMRLFLEPGDEVVNCVPTFDLFRVRALINRGSVVNVPRRPDFSVDVDGVKAAVTGKTKLVIVANPNNPTGNTISQEDILAILATGVPLLVDEAYYEFSGETCIPLVREHQNLLVLRTFSKWAGLAGLRIGYGIFQPEIAQYLMKIKMPYNVNLAAAVAVREALREADFLMERIRRIIAERDRMFSELKQFDWLRPYPSKANFIFCFLERGNAVDMQDRLLKKGVLVRYFDQPPLQNGFRISVGKPEHTNRLIEALRGLEGTVNG